MASNFGLFGEWTRVCEGLVVKKYIKNLYEEVYRPDI